MSILPLSNLRVSSGAFMFLRTICLRVAVPSAMFNLLYKKRQWVLASSWLKLRRTHRNCHLSTSMVMKSGKGRTHPYSPSEIFTRRLEVYGMSFEAASSAGNRGADHGLDRFRLARRFGRVKLENWSALGRFFGLVDVNLIDASYEPRAEPRPPCVRSKDLPNKFSGFRRPQLDRPHLLSTPSNGDGCPAGSTEVAHPVDFAEGADRSEERR